jgi:4-amino-4-deoxy-L-arabinose transferase-like glycosyltransferase
MRSLLVRRPDTVVWLLAGYFLLGFLIRVFVLPDALRVDESQQAFFSQWLTTGYDTQPPLFNWLQSIFVSIFGLSVATVAAPKSIVLFLLFVTYYKLAKLVLEDRLFAVIATLTLLTIPQVFWQAQRDLTHTVMQMLMINLLLWSTIKTLKAPSLASYLMIGVSLALGMMSKYNFALVVVGTLVAVWLHPEGKARLFNRRFLLSIAVSLLLLLPHGLWLIENVGVASDRTLSMMATDAPAGALAKFFKGPYEFFELVVVILGPSFLIYSIVFGKPFIRNLRTSTLWSRFFDTVFVVIALSVLAMIFAIGITAMRDRWMLPFLFIAPIAWCVKMEAGGVKSQDFAKRFFWAPFVVMALTLPMFALRPTMPLLFGRYENLNIPYRDFVDQIVSAEGKRPGLLLTDGWLPSGNLHLQLPDVPAISTFFGNLKIGYEWTAEKPILVAWFADDGKNVLPQSLDDWIRDNLGPQYVPADVKSANVPYAHGRPEDTRAFGYVWIYPK